MYVAVIEKKNSESEEESVFYRKFTVETTAEAVIEFSVWQLICDLSPKASSPSPRFRFVFVFVGVSVFSFLLE